ncbi:PAS domain-containing sensor histidine kinase [Consotaella aegiceratis]|uniref:PAS domain-containing sensor histidine kinase n=1 Tax=Consotaella aegiceratis TaxID=3097961 RepID=UPI002F3EAC65
MSLIWDLLGSGKAILERVRPASRPPRPPLPTASLLRHAIPIFIVVFLSALACVRFISLMDARQTIEDGARDSLKVAASLLQAQSESLARGAADLRTQATTILTSAIPQELSEHGRFALISDASGTIVGTTPGQEHYVGSNLNQLLPGIQPLLMFGIRADVLDSDLDGEPVIVANARLEPPFGSTTFIQRQSDILADWRESVSINVSLYAITSLVLLVILFAYFRQADYAREADALYLEAHQRVDTALCRGRCGLWDWDIARGRMYWSRSMYELLGMRPQRSIVSFAEVDALIHPDDGKLVDIARAVAAGKLDLLDETFRMRQSNGEYRWLRARAEVMRSSENEVHLIGIAVDITEQQAMVRRTTEANTRLFNAIENISESFVLWDSQKRLVLCNSKYQQVLGLATHEVMPGTPYDTIMARARKPIENRRLSNPAFADGERVNEALLPDGRWLQISERQLTDGGYVSIGTDITQLKMHQERLSDSERRLMATINDLSVARRDAEAQARQLSELNRRYGTEKDRAEAASRAKTTFLANMSHELRTPLNAIIGFSEIMREASFGPLGSDRYVEYASDIHQSGHYLLRLINDILDMSKIEAGRLILAQEDMNLAETIDEAMNILKIQAKQKSIEVDARVADSLHVSADRRAAKQILLNLLANAVKFTGDGGTVRLRARSLGETIVVTISDTGIGIPRASLENLGRPFEQVENELTRTNKGTGLGLAIARSLIHLHGGRFRIVSTVGEGTIVAMRLPQSRPQEIIEVETGPRSTAAA